MAGNTGPWRSGTRVIVRETYPGEIVGHRGPGYLVKLDRQVGEHKVVLAAPHDIRPEPQARRHARCPYCAAVLANHRGGVRVGGYLICAGTGPCARRAQAGAKARREAGRA